MSVCNVRLALLLSYIEVKPQKQYQNVTLQELFAPLANRAEKILVGLHLEERTQAA